jgi:hypothetical protein
MDAATTIVSILLAALLALAAGRKLTHADDVVESYRRAGVPEERLNALAIVLLAGAAGLILGLVWAPIGVAAGIGVVLYFVGAVVAHVRADDTKRLPTPLAFEAIALAALALRVATL